VPLTSNSLELNEGVRKSKSFAVSPLAIKLRKSVVKATVDYQMIEEGDRILVAVSGGKDSSVLLYLLEQIRLKCSFKFSLHPVILDQKQPGFDVTKFRGWVNRLGYELVVLQEDTYSITVEKTAPGKSFCGLCSRLRRGILYSYAHRSGFNKIALGHHRDDANQTLLLNMFYGGSLEGLPPKLRSDDGRNTVIRPLCYIGESKIAELAVELAVPVIPCNLCGSQANMARKRMKKLLEELSVSIPRIQYNLFAAQANLKPSQLFDKRHHRF